MDCVARSDPLSVMDIYRSWPSVVSPDVAVDLTTEVRWFFDNRLESEVWSWFTRDGAGLEEKRSDTYRFDGRDDMGVKWRFGTTLELKLRMRPPEPFVSGRSLDGFLEIWQRWSPAGDRVHLSENTRWIEVDKIVVKRRFDPDGQELPLSDETRVMEGLGCDCEVAAVSIAGHTTWTFSFAAFGPLDRHRDAISAAWGRLQGSAPLALQLTRAASRGYPEWLAKNGADSTLDQEAPAHS